MQFHNIQSLILKVFGLGYMCFFTFEAAAQSGWTKEKTEGFYQLSFQSMKSDDYYSLTGDLLETNQFSQQSLVFYGEYGVTDKFTIIANWPLQIWNGFETTETVSGLGDLRLEFKHSLLKKYLPLSISIAPEFPIGRANNFAQSTVNDFEQINLPSGDGEFNVWTTLASSFALPDIPLYGNLFSSYNFRTQYEGISFSDQFAIGAEIGYHIADLVWVNARLNALNSVNEVEVATDFVRGDGSEYTAYSFGASVPVYKNIHVTVNYRNFNDWIFKRKNIYSSGVIGFGVYYEYKPKKP
ncbi:hypothetical protein [Algoriphagus chordae]|uniref:Uncharacterized protein n=1 Tax=Algoriphagus chordae TaxID=237019 RepID=A0A2W7RCN9_9BACT|nr:hypothetical protein [Algoriphagus chordae]PZX51939.1 hypothetical protein LV85_02088 [Algoriphagus chordae]